MGLLPCVPFYRLFLYHPRSEGDTVFSSVRLCVCLSVNMIIPEPLEMSSRNFHGIILWSKGSAGGTVLDFGLIKVLKVRSFAALESSATSAAAMGARRRTHYTGRCSV